MLLSEAFEQYRRDYIVYSGQSAKTEESHNLAGRSLVAFTGDIELQALSFQHVRDWKENLERKMTTNTSRLYIIKLRNVLKHMRLNGEACISHEAIVVPKRKATNIEFLTPEEVKMLLDSIERTVTYTRLNKARNIAIVSLLYASGIRVSELCSLNVGDMRIPGSFTVIGKGNKPRLCFYDERADEAIKTYLSMRQDHNPALFVSDLNGLRINAGGVQLIFRNAARNSGIGRSINPHMMRHSFATNLLRNNTNLYYVSKFLGHKSTQTTEMYTHYVDEDLRNIYMDKHSV